MHVTAPSHPPLYRTLFREALSTAWHHPHLWLLAFFAALLQTGGIYDALLQSFRDLGGVAVQQLQGSSLTQGLFSWAIQPMSEIGKSLGILGSLGRIEGLLLALVLLGIASGASVIAQGGLIYGLGIRLRGSVPPLATCLSIGGRYFWKIAGLNLITLGLIAAFRVLVLIPFSTPLAQTSAWTIVGSLLAYFFYIFAVITLTAVHLFGLNSIVLQRYSLTESVLRGFAQAKQAWLVILELGLGFFLLGTALFFGLTALYVIAGIPLLILTLSAALLNAGLAATILSGVFYVGALLAFILLGSFATTVQFAAWQGLSIRVAQGNALAKIHRLFTRPKR
ncbi:hypothetical protein KBB27_00325 [Patescibacteria group bacterium]|nr:hypothetical protein [Patescibacteria group bacterium]